MYSNIALHVPYAITTFLYVTNPIQCVLQYMLVLFAYDLRSMQYNITSAAIAIYTACQTPCFIFNLKLIVTAVAFALLLETIIVLANRSFVWTIKENIVQIISYIAHTVCILIASTSACNYQHLSRVLLSIIAILLVSGIPTIPQYHKNYILIILIQFYLYNYYNALSLI